MAIDPPVLDLVTEQQTRHVVKIDGKPYVLRTANDLSISDYRVISRLSPRVHALLMAEENSSSESQELEAHLDKLCPIAIDAPAAILEKLTAVHKAAIFGNFSELLTPSLERQAAKLARQGNPKAGSKSSRGSNGSTAGRRRNGRARR